VEIRNKEGEKENVKDFSMKQGRKDVAPAFFG
jgi:hypothetical protein